jgi:chromosome segregation ATPase
MAADLGSKAPELGNSGSQLASHQQDVSSSSTMASDSQLSLNGTMVANLESSSTEDVSPAQFELLKVQVETLQRNLQSVENKLSEESALRIKAECGLDESKVREKSLLKIEQDGKALREEVKWRNEQFQSLQEAHNRTRDQFHEGQKAWASEKAAMLRNIEVLTENAAELESLQAVVNDVRECNTKAEHRILLLEDRLRDAQRELEAKNNLSQSLLSVQEHEEVVLAMRSEYEALQRQVSNCDAERFELEKERDKLLAELREKKQPHQRGKEELLGNAEVEGRRDRSSLPAGQRINTRRQLEDFAKQVKSLNTELQKWKDMATESSEGSSKLQTSLESVRKENEELRVQLDEWMQKALKQSDSIKDLQAEVEKWKHSATTHSDENRLRIDGLEHLRAEVEKWKDVETTAEGEGKSARMKPLDSLGMFEDGMEVISSNPTGECDSERSLREEELDRSLQESGRTSNESRHVASEPETSLQAELEDWKKRVTCAEKEQEDMRQFYETAVEELHEELETGLEEFQVKSRDAADHVVEERQRSVLELAELQAELQNWKARAADAAEECTSLRVVHESVSKELQLCKENAEAATEKGKSVRADLEKEVQDLESQVHVWKQKAEEALQDVVKIQEYEDMIKALDQERGSVRLQLERALLEMEEKAAASASVSQALKDELNSAFAEKTAEIHQLCIVITGLKLELSELKEKADDNHSSQLLQLQSLLTETQSQLQEWQEKATVAFQAEDELRHAIGEIKSQTEELHNLIRALKDELLEWKEKAEQLETLQLQLTSSLASSQDEIQLWKQKAMDAAMASELVVRNSVSDLKTELSQWKEKAQEGEILHQQMRTSLTETQMELQDMKEKIAAFASSTDSLKDELCSANQLASTLTTQLSTQKQNVSSLQKLNRRLEADLELVREEALSRKEWMNHILTQLEGTVSMSQKELQNKLHLTQHRLLGDDSVDSRVVEEVAAQVCI